MDSSFVKIFPKSLRLPIALGAIAASAILGAGNAKAVLVYELIEQGSDVQVKLSGSLSGLPSPTVSTFPLNPPQLDPGSGIISFTNQLSHSSYSISGPVGFGTSLQSNVQVLSASIDSALATLPFDKSFNLSSGYVEGTPITSAGLIIGKSLSALGLSSTSGLLGTWTIGSDSIEVWAGAKSASSPAAAPGPLPLLGAGAAFVYSRRLRSRLRGSRPSLKA